jgi:hypothetical protein
VTTVPASAVNCHPVMIRFRSASIAYVIGFSRATTRIQPGISASGASAVLANVSGRLAKPVIGKNCEWLRSENASATDSAVIPAPNNAPIARQAAMPPMPAA